MHRILPPCAPAIHADPWTFRLLCSLLVVSLASSGCRGNDPWLVIVARSDLAPREEVDRIDVELVGIGVPTSTAVGRSATLREGLTVYERQLATLRGRRVRITFFVDGEEIAVRDLVLDHMTDREIVVDVPRLCVDADCDDLETCVLGQCAPSICVEGDEPDCPPAMCEDDAQCAVEGVTCATGVCARGACLAYGDDDACAQGEWCDPLIGCAVERAPVNAAAGDGGGNGGMSDAGVDVGAADAGTEDDGAADATSRGDAVDAGMLAI